MRLAIIDLDGVVANVDARFQRAEVERALYLAGTDQPEMLQKEATSLYWREVFNPESVPMDRLIDGADGAIHRLELDDYQVVYLTSRPDSMRKATYDWLLKHQLSGPRLVMKPPAAQYVKTVLWKAVTVQMLVFLYCADEVLVVDDEPANLDKLREYDTSSMRLCSSLVEAIAPNTDVDISDIPF